MKLNGKSKIETTDFSVVDQVTKESVSKMETTVIQGFNPQITWQKIAQQLGQVDKRFVTWGFAMAASISLLVAANFDMIVDNINILPQEKFVPSLALEYNETVLNTFNTRNTPMIAIASSPINMELSTIKASVPAFSNAQNKAQNTVTKKDNNRRSKHTDFQPIASNPFITLQGQMSGFSNGNMIPEFGIDFKLRENYTAKRREILKLGFSTQLYYTTVVVNEVIEKQLTPYTFINLTYINLDKETNKGWTGRAGYLLNPDGVYYQDTTLKVSLLRNIGKHIKVGPEFIFTNTFSKVYPGLSLILG